MDLHTAGHKRGVAAAPHHAAAEAGRHVLAEGGNAIDAAVVAAGVLGVTEPFSCGIAAADSWSSAPPTAG